MTLHSLLPMHSLHLNAASIEPVYAYTCLTEFKIDLEFGPQLVQASCYQVTRTQLSYLSYVFPTLHWH